MSESFNSWIIEARFKPIITMLEDIRIQVTRRIQENRSNSERWLMTICPNILRKVRKIRHATQFCHVLWNGEAGFEVREKKWKFTVNLNMKTCSCRYWQVCGIPCQHACAALFVMSAEPNNYLDRCFSIEQYKRTYQHVLQPVEHESAWPVSPNPRPLPPRVKKMPGRPKKNRRKDPSEQKKSSTKSSKDPSERKKSSTKSSKSGTKIKCRRCKGEGHNARTCSLPMMEDSTSHDPPQQRALVTRSQASTTPLSLEPAQSKPSRGKRPAATSNSESSKSKIPEGYGLYYSERTGSSFIQSGHKRQMVSFGRSKSTAQASANAGVGGSASVVIETSAGRDGAAAKATINLTGGQASAKISSIGRGKLGQSSNSQKNSGSQLVSSDKSIA